MTLPRVTRTTLILFGLVVLAFGLDALFFTGFYASDDISYLSGARAIAGDGAFVPDLGSVRIGLTLPSAVVWSLTGSITAVVWLHALYHPLLVVLAFVLGRMLHGERAGLIGAALVATSPLLYQFAGAVLPDNATACWLTASTIVLCKLRRGPINESLSSRRRLVGYFTAGVLLGIAYTCKETALIMTLPAAAFTISAGPVRSVRWIRDGAMLALGLALVMLAEYLTLRAIGGVWISRIAMLSTNAADFRDYMSFQGTLPHDRLYFAAVTLHNVIPITLWVFVGAAIAYVVLRGRDLALAFAFWWPLIYMTIGSTQLTEYIPPTIQNRYYAIVIVPAAIMTAKVALAVIDRVRPAAIPLAIAFAVIVLFEVWRGLPHAGSNYKSNEARAFTAALEIAHRRYPQYPIVIAPFYQMRMNPLLADSTFPAPARGAPYVTVELTATADLELAATTPKFQLERLEDVLPPLTAGMRIADFMQGVLGLVERRRSWVQRRHEASATLLLVTPRTP